MCIPYCNKARKAASSFAGVKYSASCSFSWCIGAAFLVLKSAGWCCGPLIKDFRCSTPHAQRTAGTYFTGAVTSDGVHSIVACWAFLEQTKKSFRASQIVHTGWPADIFAYACVKINSKSTLFVCVPSCNKAYIAATSCAIPKCFAFTPRIMVHCCGGFGNEQCWVVLRTPQ